MSTRCRRSAPASRRQAAHFSARYTSRWVGGSGRGPVGKPLPLTSASDAIAGEARLAGACAGARSVGAVGIGAAASVVGGAFVYVCRCISVRGRASPAGVQRPVAAACAVLSACARLSARTGESQQITCVPRWGSHSLMVESSGGSGAGEAVGAELGSGEGVGSGDVVLSAGSGPGDGPASGRGEV